MSETITFRPEHNVIVHPDGGGCDLMFLAGERLVISSTEERERFDKDKIKALVGSDQITGRIVVKSS